MSNAAGERMTCRECVELVTDYLEGRLSPADRERFEGHLAICPGCQNYIEQTKATLGALGRVREEELSPAARAELLHAFRERKAAQ